jgi:hypothetical protein
MQLLEVRLYYDIALGDLQEDEAIAGNSYYKDQFIATPQFSLVHPPLDGSRRRGRSVTSAGVQILIPTVARPFAMDSTFW